MPESRQGAAGSKRGSFGQLIDPDPLIEGIRRARPGPSPYVTIDGQRYRQINNGRANVLVPVEDPLAEARRQGRERLQYQAGHPLGSGLYGVAALAGASPQASDRAMRAGGLIDEAMVGLLPRTTSSRVSNPQLKGQLAPYDRQEARVELRELNANGQAMGGRSWLSEPMLGTGKKVNPKVTPSGWQHKGVNQGRGHLFAKSLGGPGGLEKRNFVTLTQNPTNSPQMSGYERHVADRVRSGEFVEYSVIPFYNGPGRAPSSVLMTAHGNRGAPTARLVLNPAGRRK